MKVQIQAQALRWRVDEREFAQLLAGAPVIQQLQLGGGVGLRHSVELVAADRPALLATPDHWRLQLPRAAVQAYGLRLPCREGLQFTLPLDPDQPPLLLSFDVDVRDSIRQRGVPPRTADSKTPP